MPVHSFTFNLKTSGFNDVHDITPKVSECLSKSELRDGIIGVFIPGSTAGITTIEYEHGVIEDLKKAVDRLVPRNIHYDHDARWGDGNGFSHVRASLIGPSITVPFSDGELQMGTWQQIILIDFDNRSRQREVIVKVVGD